MATFPGADGVGMFGGVTGVLELTDGCILIKPTKGQALIPVFPGESVSWDAELKAITTDGRTMTLGKTYTLGGGGVQAPGGDAYVPTRCPESLGFFQVGFLPE